MPKIPNLETFGPLVYLRVIVELRKHVCDLSTKTHLGIRRVFMASIHKYMPCNAPLKQCCPINKNNHI
jgi:hypothetical protein